MYVVADNVAERRDVTLGFEEAELVEITAGLSEGEQIIIVGQDGLSDGTPINVLAGGDRGQADASGRSDGPPAAVAAPGGGAPGREAGAGAPTARAGGGERRPGGRAGGAGGAQMDPEQMRERMKARGMSDEQIEERIKQMQERRQQEAIRLAKPPRHSPTAAYEDHRLFHQTSGQRHRVHDGCDRLWHRGVREPGCRLAPDITYPSLTVRTEYEGVAPAEIESLVTRPLENAVGVVNNVVKVSSSSRADTSEVTLEFVWGTDMDMAALDVRERLDLVRLPEDVAKPILLRYDPSLDPVMRLGLSGDDDLIQLRLVAERQIERALERVEGVAAVVVSGGLIEEIQIELDERRLANLGLSLGLVSQRLAQENINLTGGRLQEGQTEYLVRTINEFDRPADMRSVVIDNSSGSIIRLEDIARIVRGHKEREAITRIDGQESVEIAIYKEGGTNSVTVVDAVNVQLEAVQEKLDGLGGRMQLTLITDQARYIRQSIDDVMRTAAIGGSLAILILLLFLGNIKPTLIIGISIPISVVATFFLMYIGGISLNIMSLGGLTLGIGLLVDNSIVVLESIQRKREEGLGVVEAASVGAAEVGQAVIASTMTTVCVFVPIVFVEGIAGQLFGDQALTVTSSLAVSLIVALTLIPCSPRASS